MTTTSSARTVGDLKKILATLNDDLPIGISYSPSEGLGEILVVMADKDYAKAKFWIGLDAFDTDDILTEGEEEEAW